MRRLRKGLLLQQSFFLVGPRGTGTLTGASARKLKRIQTADLRGLRAFRDDYPEATCVLLHRGSERRVENGILCQPVDEFLRGVDPSRELGVSEIAP